MAELPTKEELEQLYREKGHDALVWYAWRCSLRTIPILGRTQLDKLWPENTAKHAFSILSSTLILPHLVNSPRKVRLAVSDIISRVDSAIYEAEEAALETVDDEASDVATSEYGYVYTEAAESSEADPYEEIANEAAQFFHGYVTSHSSAAVESAASALKVFNSTYSNNIALEALFSSSIFITSVYPVFADAARADYNFIRKTHSIDNNNWYSRPLWPTNVWVSSKNLQELEAYKNHLLSELDLLALDFIADDLKQSWGMQSLGSHVANYLIKLSDAVLHDPIALRATIISGENQAEVLQSVRILLLGPGGAGKSSLRDRLRGKSIEESINRIATTGVEYDKIDLSLLKDINPDLKVDSNLDLRLWDFGGQAIFHGLHRAFLHENCVYILVVDSRHEQAPDDWLYQIRDLTKDGNKPRVLLVTNRYEGCDTRQNESRLLREFGDLLISPNQFYYFSCHDSSDIQFIRFIQELVSQCQNSRHQVLKLAMDVQRKMQKALQNQVFMEEDQIEEFIPADLVETFQETVITHLDQLGYMIPVESGETTYCLKPEWTIQNAYYLLNSEPLQREKGVVQKSFLKKILKGKAKSEEVNYLVQFLQSRHLCRKLKNNYYFFPDASSTNEPQKISQYYYDKSTLALRFDFPFMPLGIHTKFIRIFFNPKSSVQILRTNEIWRQGFLLTNSESKAVVQYSWRKSCIELLMVGEETNHFSGIITAFDKALDSILEEGCLIKSDVQPYVLYGEGKHVYSIHSSDILAKKLREITHIDQLYPKVQAMAANKVINIGDKGTYIESAESSQIAANSKHFTQNNQPQTLSINEQETLQKVVNALRDNFDSFDTEQQIAVLQTQKALESPQEAQSAEFLGKAYAGLLKNVDGLATFTKDKAIPIADFVIKNKESIGAALAAAAATVGA